VTAQRKDRRAKADRRSGADRRTEKVPVAVEHRAAADRRSGIERRVESLAAGDQIQAALDLLTRAVEKGVLFDEDRWLLETAMTRLRAALGQLDEEASGRAG